MAIRVAIVIASAGGNSKIAKWVYWFLTTFLIGFFKHEYDFKSIWDILNSKYKFH